MKRGPKPPRVRLVPVTVCLTTRAYDAYCRQAFEKQQSLSAVLRKRLEKTESGRMT